MSDFPAISGLDMVKALQRGGFFVVRQRGSHVRMVSKIDASRRVTVPMHAGWTLKRGVVVGILDQTGWTLDDLKALAQRLLSTVEASSRSKATRNIR